MTENKRRKVIKIAPDDKKVGDVYWLQFVPKCQGNVIDLLFQIRTEMSNSVEYFNSKGGAWGFVRDWETLAMKIAEEGYPMPNCSIEDAGREFREKYKEVMREQTIDKERKTKLSYDSRMELRKKYFEQKKRTLEALSKVTYYEESQPGLDEMSQYAAPNNNRDLQTIITDLNLEDIDQYIAVEEAPECVVDSAAPQQKKTHRDVIEIFWCNEEVKKLFTFWGRRIPGLGRVPDLLIKLRVEMKDQFQKEDNDDYIKQKHSWTELARRMAAEGFEVPAATEEEAGLKCYQQWQLLIEEIKPMIEERNKGRGIVHARKRFHAIYSVVGTHSEEEITESPAFHFALERRRRKAEWARRNPNRLVRAKWAEQMKTYWQTPVPELNGDMSELLVKLRGDMKESFVTVTTSELPALWDKLAEGLEETGHRIPSATPGLEARKKWRTLADYYKTVYPLVSSSSDGIARERIENRFRYFSAIYDILGDQFETDNCDLDAPVNSTTDSPAKSRARKSNGTFDDSTSDESVFDEPLFDESTLDPEEVELLKDHLKEFKSSKNCSPKSRSVPPVTVRQVTPMKTMKSPVILNLPLRRPLNTSALKSQPVSTRLRFVNPMSTPTKRNQPSSSQRKPEDSKPFIQIMLPPGVKVPDQVSFAVPSPSTNSQLKSNKSNVILGTNATRMPLQTSASCKGMKVTPTTSVSQTRVTPVKSASNAAIISTPLNRRGGSNMVESPRKINITPIIEAGKGERRNGERMTRSQSGTPFKSIYARYNPVNVRNTRSSMLKENEGKEPSVTRVKIATESKARKRPNISAIAKSRDLTGELSESDFSDADSCYDENYFDDDMNDGQDSDVELQESDGVSNKDERANSDLHLAEEMEAIADNVTNTELGIEDIEEISDEDERANTEIESDATRTTTKSDSKTGESSCPTTKRKTADVPCTSTESTAGIVNDFNSQNSIPEEVNKISSDQGTSDTEANVGAPRATSGAIFTNESGPVSPSMCTDSTNTAETAPNSNDLTTVSTKTVSTANSIHEDTLESSCHETIDETEPINANEKDVTNTTNSNVCYPSTSGSLNDTTDCDEPSKQLHKSATGVSLTNSLTAGTRRPGPASPRRPESQVEAMNAQILLNITKMLSEQTELHRASIATQQRYFGRIEEYFEREQKERATTAKVLNKLDRTRRTRTTEDGSKS